MNIRIVRAVAMVTAFAAAPLYAAELKSLSWEGDALRVEVKGKPGFTTAVLDDGPTPRAQASTVIDCTHPTPQILREGPIAAADLHLETTKPL